jgi:hypothetical protein
MASARADAPITAADSGSPIGFTPQQIRTAYGISSITFGTLPGDGSGQTIAIVDAYDDPAFVNSTDPGFSASDLAQFDRQFSLPDPPSFTKVNQYGGNTGLPGTDPAGPGSPTGNWEYEIALDVEWAHALAPNANIVLVECNSDSASDLYAGVATAGDLPGVSAVSMSWGAGESSQDAYRNLLFETPSGHPGVTFVASAGDAGAPGIYPAFSPKVVAVGGTTLSLGSDGSYQGETAWSSGGGGASSLEAEPAYQQAVQSTGHRTIPDVAFDGDPATGVAIYDSYDDTGAGPWRALAGTSLGAPSWAALIAIADQGRAAAGATTLDGATQTLPALYALPAADFHDITSGGNGGSSAGPGYDQVTGLGTPRADLLVPDLASYGLPDRLVVTAQPPGSVTAGSSFGLAVAIVDGVGSPQTAATGTVTVSIASPSSPGNLDGTLTATFDRGVATFSDLSIDRAGAGYSLGLSAAGLDSVTSSSFTVGPAAPALLAIASQPPPSVTAGAAFGLTVLIEDRFGNAEDSYDGVVGIALAGGPAGAVLAGLQTAMAHGGIADFPGLTIDRAGTGYTIAATGAGLSSATTSAFDVTSAALTQLVLTSQPPDTVAAGVAFVLAAVVEDAYGNLVTSFAGRLTASLSGGPDGATLGGRLAVSAADGVAAFSGLTLDRAGGGYTVRVSSGDLSPATTRAITVTAARPARLVISSQPPGTITAGTGFGLAVLVEDAYGNPETTYGGEVTVSLASGPGDGLGGPVVATPIGGVVDFSGLTLTRAGAGYTLRTSSPGLSGATTDSFVVAPAAPAQLVIGSQPPASPSAGEGFGVAVLVEDVFGNLETTYGGAVSVEVASGPGRGLGGVAIVPALGGVAQFSGLTIDQAGQGYDLLARGTAISAVVTNAFSVTPAAPAQLVIATQPPPTVAAGAGFGLAADVEDVYGNLVTTYGDVVTVGVVSGPGRGLNGTQAVSALGGVATFSGLSIDLAGDGYALLASGSGISAMVTNSFHVTPAAPAQLVVAVPPPASVTAGQPFGFSAAVEDPYGNLETDFDGPVTAAPAGRAGAGPLGGNLTVAVVDGVATFSGLTMTRAGSGAAIAVSSAGLGTATTPAFAVVPAAPDRWVVTTPPPASVPLGGPFALTVAAEDRFGNVATGFSGTVTASLAADPGHPRLLGSPTATASAGVATFSRLSLKKAGKGFEVVVSGSGLSPTSTRGFNVISPKAMRALAKEQAPHALIPGRRSKPRASIYHRRILGRAHG